MAKHTIHFEDIESGKYKVIDGTAKPGFVGRWFEKEIDGVKHTVTLSDGSTCYFLTDGAESFNVNFTVITTGKTPFFAYSIDGSEPVRQLITKPCVNLPDNGIHKVCIWADGMTETEGKWDSEKGFALRDITVESGALYGIMPQKKTIAYYGDSITEGIRALNMYADSDGNSATHSYPYHCSKILDTLTHSVGYGATGIIATGSFNKMLKAIDNMSAEVKEIEGFMPDVIVVNHGTNDQLCDDDRFKAELIKTLDRLVEKHPDVPVFYAIPFGQHKAAAIREISTNYPTITVIETDGWGVTFTDGVHPDANGAKIAGEKLAEAIKTSLGEDFFKN